MAANSTISVTELDFNTIKSSLKTYISSKPEFTDYDFEGSTISMLLDLLSYNTYQNAFYSSMVGNEMFLDSAQLRDNIVSRAKMLNYSTRSARGASTTAAVTITPSDTPPSITIAKNTEWSATVDGVTYKFVTPQAYTFTEAQDYSGTIGIVEGRTITHRFTVNNANPVKYILPNKRVDTTSIAVTVEVSSEDSTSTTYTLANDITEVKATSTVYFLQEVEDEQYEIYFGDDVIGKQLDTGNIVNVQYRVCNGVEGNGIDTFTNPSTLGGYSSFTFTVSAKTSGGSDIESIDSIKYNAPKNFETQNRAVLAEDYKRIILRDNGDIASVNVWGGEENTPPIYGKVYVSVKPTNGTVISASRKNTIKTNLKKYNILSIDTEFVDATYLYIKPTVKAKYQPDLTTLTAAAIQQKILNTITRFETNNLGTFENKHFRYSRFTDSIDDSDPSVLNNITTIIIEKRLVPSTTITQNYVTSFSNRITNPHAGHQYAISSSSFTYENRTSYLDDDGNGNIRVYYLNNINARVYLDRNIGTINYSTGVVELKAFKPTAYSGSYISIFADPFDADIIALRNQILLIAGATVELIDDNTSVVVAQSAIATTAGVTVNTPTGSTSTSVVY